jgi:hypothetical protein
MTRIQRKQWDFLVDVFISNSVAGALGHSGTYIETKNKQEEKRLAAGKERLNKVLKAALCELAAKYSTAVAVTPEEHMKNIQELIDRANASCADFFRKGELGKGTLRFGVAAKMFNLWLKYLWCVAKISIPPPHFPFDRKLIQECLGFKSDDWTKINDPDRYLKWVRKAEKLRNQENQEKPDQEKLASLAEWELYAWSGESGCQGLMGV